MDLVEAEARGFESGSRHPWERARLAIVSSLIARHVRPAPGDSVLDVGCGDTFVADALARQHPRVSFHAVDSAFTPSMIALYRSRLTSPNLSLSPALDEVRLDRPAVLVLLMDVIEHVPDDRAFLRDLLGRGLIDDRTRVLITVPSYPALFSSHDRFLGHYRRYNRRSLQALFDAVGLTALDEGHFFGSLLLPRLAQAVRETWWPPPPDRATHVAGWTGGETAAKAIAAVLEADGYLSLWLARLGIKLPGLSNFAICRKSA